VKFRRKEEEPIFRRVAQIKPECSDTESIYVLCGAECFWI